MAGRKSKITKISLRQVEKLAGLGLIESEIADVIGIDPTTLTTYKKVHPQFLLSIKKGKLKADNEVVKSLYKRALGYSYNEVTYEKSKTGGLGIKLSQGEIEQIAHCDTYKTKIVTKHVSPETLACIFWLKNRQPEKWRDRVEFEPTEAFMKDLLEIIPVKEEAKIKSRIDKFILN
jgi:hypothetical protein